MLLEVLFDNGLKAVPAKSGFGTLPLLKFRSSQEMNQIGKVFDQTLVIVFDVNQPQKINFIPRLPIFCVIYRH